MGSERWDCKLTARGEPVNYTETCVNLTKSTQRSRLIQTGLPPEWASKDHREKITAKRSPRKDHREKLQRSSSSPNASLSYMQTLGIPKKFLEIHERIGRIGWGMLWGTYRDKFRKMIPDPWDWE